jgi:succinoglycan biosynthesis protein ExoA
VNASTFPLKQSGAATATAGNVLIVIPTLNEADHIGRLVDWLSGQLDRLQARLVVVDGGSSDQTCKIVQDRSSDRVKLIQNPHRLQSAALNLAVAQCADERTTWLIRVDAHAHYPDDFCDILLDEAQRRGADSVVVSMEAVGSGFWQRAIALAQNSRFGNGGSAHRLAGAGKWVDHGHHALMRIDTFKDVGGYDPSFSHNEDAELDLRLAKAGHRIWLTGRTRLQYCSAVGLLLGWSSRDFRGVLAGYLAGIMQAAWSLGFWREVLGRLSRRTST